MFHEHTDLTSLNIQQQLFKFDIFNCTAYVQHFKVFFFNTTYKYFLLLFFIFIKICEK